MLSANRASLFAFVLLLSLHAAPSAQAKERSGLAIGAETGLTNTGLSIKYAVGNFHIQLVEGLDLLAADADSELNGVDFSWVTTLRFTYNVARMTEETNLWVGVAAIFDVYDDISDDNDGLDVRLSFELLIGVEHFFNDNFAVGGFFGVPFRLNTTKTFEVSEGTGPDEEIVKKIATGLGVSIRAVAWGAGFHWYF